MTCREPAKWSSRSSEKRATCCRRCPNEFRSDRGRLGGAWRSRGDSSMTIIRTTTLVAALALGLLAAPLAGQAQESIPRTRVGFLGAESAATNHHFLDAFRQGLREYGYVDGQNLALETRWAEGRSERFPELIG